MLQAAGPQRDAFRRARLCCGRPLYDFGMLDRAKAYLQRVMDRLAPQIDAGVPIVVLEPSCASVFRDELRNLFPTDARAEKLRKQTFLLSEFLERHAPGLPAAAARPQRAAARPLPSQGADEDDRRGIAAEEDGRAGRRRPMPAAAAWPARSASMRDKYDVSMAIGERVLLPAVRNAPSDTLIVSDGFSCREQIARRRAARRCTWRK